MSWELFWTIVFAVTILVYSILVIIVTVGGWQDIQSMLKTLDEQDESNET